MNKVQIQFGSAIGRPLLGEDHYSGLIFYQTTLPTGFTASDRIKQVFSVAEAEDLGIVSTLSGTAIANYHVSEFFRIQPKGVLYIGVYSADSTFNEIVDLQNFSEGKLRQIGVFTSTNFATSQVGTLQTQANACDTQNTPIEILYAANFTGVTDLTTLSDLTALNAKNVSVVIGQDGAGTGAGLYTAHNKSISTLGAVLGAVSLSRVSDSIAWPGKYNFANGELDKIAFANGTLYTSVSNGLIEAIDSKGYIFMRKHVGYPGTFANNPYTCIASTSFFSRIPVNRTAAKAKRNLRTYLLPYMASPMQVNDDGTLAETTIGTFEAVAQQALDQMVRNAEISKYKITIDPTQDTLSTGELIIGAQVVPVGSADMITVKATFQTSLS